MFCEYGYRASHAHDPIHHNRELIRDDNIDFLGLCAITTAHVRELRRFDNIILRDIDF